MAPLLRKSVSLVAAYAIVLQGLFAGLAFAAHAGIDPSSVICASQYSPDRGDPPDRQDKNCDKCSLACGCASPGTLAPSAVVSIDTFLDTEHPILWFEAPAPLLKHQPRASRAPPFVV
jgi:hypothetical protein